jgi:type I restriction enzyme S subunit
MPLSQLAKVHSGGGAPQDTAAFSTTGFPFVRAGSLPKLLDGAEEDTLELIEPEVAKNYGLSLFPAGTVVFAKSGMSATKGHVYRLKNPAYVVNHLAALVPHEATDSAFLVRALQRFSPTVLIKDHAYPSIRLGDIESMRIQAPVTASDRTRIAEILDKADALRAKRRAALVQLDTLTQSIFLDMFGDPASNPKCWPKSELGEVVRVAGGYAFKSEDFAAEGSPVVRISNLTGDGIDFSDIARIPEGKLGKGVGFKIQQGDILIAMSGATTGKLGVVPLELSEDLYQNQRVGNYRIRDANKMHHEYLLALLRSTFYQRFLRKLAAGVAQPNVSGWQLESAVVPLAPISLQREFARRVMAVGKLKTAQRASLAQLGTFFGTLQHYAFRGEL